MRCLVLRCLLTSSFFPRSCSVDPFTRKEWFHIKAPAPFRFRDQGWTPANRTEGQKLVTDNLKVGGRCSRRVARSHAN